jgi:hypothetical protein
MGACDLPSDDGEGRIALAAPLDAVGMDEDHVGDAAPLANQTSSQFQRDHRHRLLITAARRSSASLLEFPHDGLGEAAI